MRTIVRTAPTPPPVSYSIDAAQSGRLRKVLFATGGGRARLSSLALFLLFAIFNVAVQARLRGWHDPLTLAAGSLYVASFASMVRGTFERYTVTATRATTVIFADTSLSIERHGAARAARIPFARVRSVRLTPELIAIQGNWTTYATIPTCALPDDGTQLLDFLRDRIVSKGMPDSSSHGVTTIFNSVSPVLARR